MANEIRIQLAVRVENGNFKDDFRPGQITVDQSNPGRGGYVQTIGTSEEDFNFGDITTEGWCILRNIDSTNYVTYGPKSGAAMVVMGRIEAGEIAVFRLDPAVVLRGKANAASVKLDIRVYED